MTLLALLLATQPLLPSPGGRFSPSLAEVAGRAVVTGADLSDVETCGACHADAVAQWRTSAHAFASFNNPIYRLTVDRIRSEVGKDASRFCAGCHDVSLLFDGSMSGEIAANEPRAHAGITCRTCHGIERVTRDGNGSYELASSDLPLPAPNDAQSLKAHLARVALKPLRTAELCGSCHRAFLDPGTGNPAHLGGMDDYTPWSQSAYAGSLAERIDPGVQPADCRGCHMKREAAQLGDVAAKNGTIASHRFLGGHTWLAAMAGGAERAQEFLKGTASVDVLRVSDRLHVVVRNTGVGHRFPGGTLDAQDTWLEVDVLDAEGRVVASTGDDVHVLRSLAVDERGQPLLERQTHRFRAVAYNQTIGPRDATVVEFTGMPPTAARAIARLRHRSRNLELQRAACEESHTARGAAFADASRKLVGRALDPCAPQPVTEVARADVRLDQAPTWQRLYDHGLGMSHALQEHLDEARPSLNTALEQSPERATVLCTLAQVASRQGRLDEAKDLLAQARRLNPGHPALLRTEGEALSNVWRWRDAVLPLRRAALAAPFDLSGWRDLALAEGSAGDDAASLASAQRGLSLSPRDPDLLRLQAQALDGSGLDAYLRYRADDDAPRYRALCSKTVDGCALERVPVHAHILRPR